MDTLQFWLYVIYILAGIIGLFFVWMEMKYKIRVTIKDVVKGVSLVKQYKARQWVDKDKVAYWKLAGERNKERKLLNIPPEDCIELTAKGKKYAECYRFESNEIVWIKDEFNPTTNIPNFELPPKIEKQIEEEKDNMKKKEIRDNYLKRALQQWRKDNKIISPFQPVTTNQRMSYFSNIKKAESRKGFDWKEKIVPIVAISSFVMLLLGLMIFWGEIAAPALEADRIAASMQDTNAKMVENQKVIVELLRDIELKQQSIQSE